MGPVSTVKGFRAFLLRGNVVDLAVGVVIGAAFTAIVTSVVNGVINPLVGAFGTTDLANYYTCLKGHCVVDTGAGKVKEGVAVMWGSVAGSALQFLIVAALLYFAVILPMGRLMQRHRAAREAAEESAEAAPRASEEVALLGEIRDLLAGGRELVPGSREPQP